MQQDKEDRVGDLLGEIYVSLESLAQDFTIHARSSYYGTNEIDHQLIGQWVREVRHAAQKINEALKELEKK